MGLATFPLSELLNLKKGWDGYWADPLSPEVIYKAQEFWDAIKAQATDADELPMVTPFLPDYASSSGDGVSQSGKTASAWNLAPSCARNAVDFSFTKFYPEKELSISLKDEDSFYCEYLLDYSLSEEGTTHTLEDVLAIVQKYWRI